MLSFDDNRWLELTAGYRTPVDLRPLLRRLETVPNPKLVWEELWQELYHQGDVGPGSFVAVPHLVRIHRQRCVPDWNTYALVAAIELARARQSRCFRVRSFRLRNRTSEFQSIPRNTSKVIPAP